MQRRMSVYIYINNPSNDVLREITAGIEEEGVLYDVVDREDLPQGLLSLAAANESPLGCGISLADESAALRLSSLPKEKAVAKIERGTLRDYRILGANAARLVKKKRLL